LKQTAAGKGDVIRPARAAEPMAIVSVVSLLWIINVGVIAREERYLERKFGDAYRAYIGVGCRC
jgi:protein-S-isoprenylcysteine O-methyltransferase Ste14